MEETTLLRVDGEEKKYLAAKFKRRSVFVSSLRGEERIKSVKRKEAEGKTFLQIIESPSAQRRDELEEENHSSSAFLAEPLAIQNRPRVSTPSSPRSPRPGFHWLSSPSHSRPKDSRKSVLDIKSFASKRLESARLKNEKGATFCQMIESPSATTHGLFSFDEKMPKSPRLKVSRKSVLDIKSFASKRLESARLKNKKGATFCQMIESPSATTHGLFSFDEKMPKSPQLKVSRKSVLDIKSFASKRLESARLKNEKGATFCQMIESPSAMTHGLFSFDEVKRDIEERDDDDDDDDDAPFFAPAETTSWKEKSKIAPSRDAEMNEDAGVDVEMSKASSTVKAPDEETSKKGTEKIRMKTVPKTKKVVAKPSKGKRATTREASPGNVRVTRSSAAAARNANKI